MQWRLAQQVPSAAVVQRTALSSVPEVAPQQKHSAFVTQAAAAAAEPAISSPDISQLQPVAPRPGQQAVCNKSQEEQQHKQQQQQRNRRKRLQQSHVETHQSQQGHRQCQHQQRNQLRHQQRLYAAQPKLLTSAIKRCQCWQEIQQLLELAAAAVNYIHTVAAVVHSVQCVHEPGQQQRQQLEHPQQQQQQAVGACDTAAYESWLLLQTQKLLQQHSSELDLRHTSNLLWALAKCHSHAAAERSSNSSSNRDGSSDEGLADDQQELGTHSSNSNSSSSLTFYDVTQQLLELQEQQLACLSSSNLLQQQQQQQQQQHSGSIQGVPFQAVNCLQPKPQDLSNSIWALATMRHQPPDSWLLLFWTLSQQCMSKCTMQELSNTIWAVAKLGLSPQQQWMDAFEDAFLASLQQQQCIDSSSSSSVRRTGSSQAFANVAYGIGSLCQQQQQQQRQQWQMHSDWVTRFCQATEPLLQDFTAGQLNMTLWGLTAWHSSSSSSNALRQQKLLLSAQWLGSFGAAMQQQMHAFADQGLVNTAASSYKLLLLLQQQQQQPQDNVHCSSDMQYTEQQQQQQLTRILQMVMQAVPSRVETMQPSAAAALVWASAGLGSSSSSSSTGLSADCSTFVQQYVMLHTATAGSSSSSSDMVQLLWICAKAKQLPSSVAWCEHMLHVLQQQQQQQQQEQQQMLHLLTAGQTAQLMWSLGQLLLLCRQQQQQHNLTTDIDSTNSSSTRAFAPLLCELSVMTLRVNMLESMKPLQLIEFVAATAQVTAALSGLQMQQQQQDAIAAAVPAILTAATAVLHQQQHGAEQKLQQQHMLTMVASLHTLLHHWYTTAASSSSSSTMHQNIDTFLAAAATQITGGCSYLTVRLALLLLAIAQTPSRAAAVAAAAMHDPPMQAGSAPAVAAAGNASPVLTVPGYCCSPWIQEALSDALSAEWLHLTRDQLLSAAWLWYRNSILLSGDALSDLFYTLRSYIQPGSSSSSGNSNSNGYTSQQQLLLLLLLGKHWKKVPPTAERARTALTKRLLIASQQYMYVEAIYQQQQQHPGNTAASSSSSSVIDGRYLSQLIYTVASAHIRPPEPWLLLYQQLLLPYVPQMTMLQITKVLLGLSQLGFRPQGGVVAALLNRTYELLPKADRSHLVCIIHALGRLHITPSDDWLQRFYDRVLEAPGVFRISGFGMVVWGLAKMGARPRPEWMQQLVDSTFTTQIEQQVADGVSMQPVVKPQYLANMICSFAKLGFVPDACWMSWFRAQVGQHGGALQELDHFHIEWAWRELNDHEQQL